MKAKFYLPLLLLTFGGVNAQTISVVSTTPTSNNIDGGNSVHIGVNAAPNATGGLNAAVGHFAGASLTSGKSNVLLGTEAGRWLKTSSYNVFIGMQAGNFNNSLWGSNVMIGHGAGNTNGSGWGNTFLGHMAGATSTTGSNNVYIGIGTGYSATDSHRLIIDNTNTSSPLIWGDFLNDQLKFHGKVGIGGNGLNAFGNFPVTAGGINISSYNLFVKGGILTDEVRVSLQSAWADYVFKEDYILKSLNEVEEYIILYGHLPNMPSAKQVKDEGIELGNITNIQQEKIEELTLYLIQQNKEIAELKQQLKMLLDKK